MSNIEENLTNEINEVIPSGKKDIDTIIDNINKGEKYNIH